MEDDESPLEITQLGTRTQWKRQINGYEYVLESTSYRQEEAWDVQRRIYTDQHDHIWSHYLNFFDYYRFPIRYTYLRDHVFPEFFMEQLL